MSFMNFKKLNWTNFIFVITYHLAFLIMFPLYLYLKSPTAGLVIATIVLIIINGLGITAGYHRLYSHKAYKINKIAEPLILFAGTIGIQGSALQWSHEHRRHHRFVDTENDPSS